MGTWLIFQGLLEVTDAVNCSCRMEVVRAVKVSQEITLAYRPYPKPTQVDW